MLQNITNPYLKYGNTIVKTKDGQDVEIKSKIQKIRVNDNFDSEAIRLNAMQATVQYPTLKFDRVDNPTDEIQKVYDGVEAYLISELEKRDEKLYESLTEFYHDNHMPMKRGGGYVESTSFLRQDYGDVPEGGGYISGATNEIKTVSAQTEKEIMPARTWARKVSVGYVDLMQSILLNRSIEELNERALYRAYYTELDKVAFLGWEDINDIKYGLYNNPDISTSTYTNGDWATEAAAGNADPILQDVNEGITETVGASDRFPKSLIPNLLLVSPQTIGTLVSNKVSSAGNVSIYNFLITNNYATANGIDFKIEGNPFSTGTGAGSTERHVYYQNDQDCVRMNILVNLTRLETRFNDMRYNTPYLSHFTAPEFVYKSKIRYKDGA